MRPWQVAPCRPACEFACGTARTDACTVLHQACVLRCLIETIVSAIDVFHRRRCECVRIGAIEGRNPDGIELTAECFEISLCEYTDPACFAEAVVQGGFWLRRWLPLIIRQRLCSRDQSKAVGRRKQEPRASLGAEGAI